MRFSATVGSSSCMTKRLSMQPIWHRHAHEEKPSGHASIHSGCCSPTVRSGNHEETFYLTEQEKTYESSLYCGGDRDWRTEWTGTIDRWRIRSEDACAKGDGRLRRPGNESRTTLRRRLRRLLPICPHGGRTPQASRCK